jgi:hypothetical protein
MRPHGAQDVDGALAVAALSLPFDHPNIGWGAIVSSQPDRFAA